MGMFVHETFDETGEALGDVMRLKDQRNAGCLPRHVRPVLNGEAWEIGTHVFVPVRPCTDDLGVRGREVLLIKTHDIARYALLPQG